LSLVSVLLTGKLFVVSNQTYLKSIKMDLLWISGTGIQIPSTFYNPTKSTIGFPGASGTGWIAGGGGGSTYGNPNSGGGGGGGAAVGVPALGYAGAGWGQKNYSPGDPAQPLEHGNAKANSGSGGGGNNNGRTSFDGGSGLVLIAYPT